LEEMNNNRQNPKGDPERGESNLPERAGFQNLNAMPFGASQKALRTFRIIYPRSAVETYKRLDTSHTQCRNPITLARFLAARRRRTLLPDYKSSDPAAVAVPSLRPRKHKTAPDASFRPSSEAV